MATLIATIRQITGTEERLVKGEKEIDPAVSQAVKQLQKALEANNIDDIDAALGTLQDLALPDDLLKAVSEIADFVLTADFHKAREIANNLGLGTN
jgi:hypothetical protein